MISWDRALTRGTFCEVEADKLEQEIAQYFIDEAP